MWDWEFRDCILGNSLPANSLSLDVFHENRDEFHGFIAALALCIPKVAAPVFPGSEIPPEFRPKSQLLQNPAGFSLDPPCGNGGGREFGIYSQRESVTPVPLDKGFSMIFHGKKTSFGMCWMGEKAQGHLEFPGVGIWGGKRGWNPPQDP